MFSVLMLIVVFFEMFIAIVTTLGGLLVASKYIREGRLQDLYVSLVLELGSLCNLGMLYSQVAFNLQYPSANIGFKIFLISLLSATVIIWFHLANIYGLKSKIVSILSVASASFSALLICFSKTSLEYQEGVIVPRGEGWIFVTGFFLLTAIVIIESTYAAAGLRRLGGDESERYRISKISGGFFFILFTFLFTYMFTRIIYLYIIMWLSAFLSMLTLFLVSMVPADNKMLIKNPFNFFRTRILFKLIITIVIMIVISLEGMALITISISKRALSESVKESYQRVAEDTIDMINRSKIDTSSEKKTLNSIARILEVTKIGNRGSVFLISPSNNVFLHRANQWISLGTLKSPETKKIYFGKGGGGEINMFGEKVIAAYVPIKKIKWGMIVGQPIDYAYSRIKQMEATSIIFVLIWIVLTSIIGIILARSIEDSIKEVKKGITQIGAGDLSHRINIGSIDEIGDLAAAFNQMAEELKESQESLIRADRLTSLGYMATGMAHEIKNALVPLKTLTDLLQVSGKDQMFIAKFNEMVPHEIERINRLSTELLHYSKPGEPQFDYLNVNEIIDEAEKYLRIQARKKNVSIKLELGSVAKVKIDSQKMLQVFTNLMLNSIDAMEEKGGTVWLRSRDTEDDAVIEVEDSGPGMPPEKLNRIFVPFYTTKKEGTGMGLPIVQRIVADHGGHIDVKSEVGKGTIFTISLPLIKY